MNGLKADPVEPARRRRRTRADVTGRICEAARQLFAERGYHGTTTREIARLADVSETLLFRYYGSKAGLFEFVVYDPFNRLMEKFVGERGTSTSPAADEHYIFAAAFELFEKNQALFTALLTARGMQDEDGSAPPFEGLIPFFEAAKREQLQKYTQAGQQPDIDIGIGLRLGFGMMAASVLLRDWLFPEGAPPREQILATIETLVTRALAPPVRA
jgi:AcrR family transcriptional regulator